MLEGAERKAMLDAMSAKDRTAVLLGTEKTWLSEATKSIQVNAGRPVVKGGSRE